MSRRLDRVRAYRAENGQRATFAYLLGIVDESLCRPLTAGERKDLRECIAAAFAASSADDVE